MGGGRVRYEEIAVAAANQTYAQQLTQLETAWNTLTDEEKLRCIIVMNSVNKTSFAPFAIGQGLFSYSQCTINNAYIATIGIKNKILYTWVCSTGRVTDDSSSSNDKTMSLMLLCNE